MLDCIPYNDIYHRTHWPGSSFIPDVSHQSSACSSQTSSGVFKFQQRKRPYNIPENLTLCKLNSGNVDSVVHVEMDLVDGNETSLRRPRIRG